MQPEKDMSKRYEVYTETIDQYIMDDPQTMNDFELITSAGFLQIMSFILVPTIIVGVILIRVIKNN